MRSGLWALPALLGMVLCASMTVAAAPAAAPTVAVLAQIEPGQWQLREIESTAPPRLICITDPGNLVQFDHPGGQCSQFVVEDLPRVATINYSCTGAGHGRTTIRIESKNGFHLDIQGIAGGAPFDTSFEARRIGVCTTARR
ncbi:MAG: DUF3617 domain-containing protein [Sphingomonas sp.]|nr:DUF3617 domain-containing protein [Sphingomonas sp.]